jgi:predicted AlkP superfamily pyrophosphatase or phosphodiesterase
MSNRVCVIDLPGLSHELLSAVPAQSALGKWLAKANVSKLAPSFPEVTCSVQATITTGVAPAVHGIVANGIATYRNPADAALVDASNFADYRRNVSFWEQSNQFIQARRFWQNADGSSKYKTALLFFQHCMPGFVEPLKPAADIVLTPKPDHGPDGKLMRLCWSEPASLTPEIFGKLGPFPLMNYWGPMANIKSSEWIGEAATMVWQNHEPRLQLTYVPHLDYDLQRFGPGSPQAKQAVVDLAGAVEPLVDAVLADGAALAVLSEYAISAVSKSVAPNRALAEAELLTLRDSPDGKIIDYEKSAAFAMCDHQVAHVYVKSETDRAAVAALLHELGCEVTDREHRLPSRRSGDLIAVAAADTWFDYRWWNSPADAPAFARMVDIHRKPGYDPLELFFDRTVGAIVTDASMIKGSHGRAAGPAVFAATAPVPATINATDVAGIVQTMLEA